MENNVTFFPSFAYKPVPAQETCKFAHLKNIGYGSAIKK